MSERKDKPGQREHEDTYYNRPPFSHGGFGLGACKGGAGHLPTAFWTSNRILAEHEAELVRAHHHRRLASAAPHVPLREQRALPRPPSTHVVAVTAHPHESSGRLCLHLDGSPCASLELVRGETCYLDTSHPSNRSRTLRFYTSDVEDAAEYTDGATASVAPPGFPGAHVQFRVSRAAPSVLFYRSASSGAPVDGGLVLIEDSRAARGEPRTAARARPPAPPRHKPAPDLADALAERERRKLANARLLARRETRLRETWGGVA